MMMLPIKLDGTCLCVGECCCIKPQKQGINIKQTQDISIKVVGIKPESELMPKSDMYVDFEPQSDFRPKSESEPDEEPHTLHSSVNSECHLDLKDATACLANEHEFLEREYWGNQLTPAKNVTSPLAVGIPFYFHETQAKGSDKHIPLTMTMLSGHPHIGCGFAMPMNVPLPQHVPSVGDESQRRRRRRRRPRGAAAGPEMAF